MQPDALPKLSAPFPYAGGKAAPAPYVWERFGEVDNLVEAFCGSLALTLAAPKMPAVVTCNDLDGMIQNFWRSIESDPEEVAHHADQPIFECDLHAKHAYLVKRIPWLVDRLMGDPSFCDPKLAGWWVWGTCAWIGSGWCSGKGPWVESGGMLLHRSELEAGAGTRRFHPLAILKSSPSRSSATSGRGRSNERISTPASL